MPVHLDLPVERIHKTDLHTHLEDISYVFEDVLQEGRGLRDLAVDILSTAGPAAALEVALSHLGAAEYGLALRFCIEARTSLSGTAEVLMMPRRLHDLGLTVKDLALPAHVLHPTFLDQAGQEDPVVEARFEQAVAAFRDAHPDTTDDVRKEQARLIAVALASAAESLAEALDADDAQAASEARATLNDLWRTHSHRL